MKNIMKIAFVLFGSFALLTSANAGVVEVTGTAKATYNVSGSGTSTAPNNKGKAIGITNELAFTGTGELDNGFTWKYQVELDDNASGATTADDTRLEVTTGYGTIAAYNTEGSLSTKYKSSQAAYATGSDYGSGGGMVYGENISSYNNIQYHTPADLLPYGTSIKLAYSPSADKTKASGNSAGSESTGGDGTSVSEYQISVSPVEGLTLVGSYFEKDGEGGKQEYETGGLSATYSSGPISVGVTKFGVSSNNAGNDGTAKTARRSTTNLKAYENMAMSAGLAVNDALSISYEVEKSDGQKRTATGSGVTDNSVELKVTTMQAAYTMGGMTLALGLKDISNDDYAEGQDQSETVLAVNMAF
tara:strand:- start:5868 stop:6947 length:1080 start_codon:yes stop_codon:yes gene_type:complete